VRIPVTLVTASHRKDIDRFALLCDSIDRYVTGYETHYVIVNDDDMPAFARFNRQGRIVLPCQKLLPRWLKPLPPFLTRQGRRVWFSFRSGPMHGWHIQQLVKIEAALQLPSRRFCFIDSDNVFFRPFDMLEYAGADLTPLYVIPKAIAENNPRQAVWTRCCDRLLGRNPTTFPADDYIGNLIVWDKLALQDMVLTIERVAGKSWAAALSSERAFSEYLLYGNFVRQSPQYLATHDVTTGSPAEAYWENEPLDLEALKNMVGNALPCKVALCIQSISSTPVPLIRKVAGL
jgi:Family of unknown function (DUF6492)